MEKALIVSYLFPPDTGVGGRRWSKFAKYFMAEGVKVSVLTCAKENEFKNKLIKNTDSLTLHYLPIKYPRVLIGGPTNLLEKIYYRICLFYLKVFYKGNIFDKTLMWEKSFIKKASAIIEADSIQTMIVTGPPFGILKYAVEVKKKTNCNLILDLRDPWMWENKGFGYENLNGANKSFAMKQEFDAINGADLVLVPVEVMRDYLATTYPNCINKIHLIPHGYDLEDFKQIGIPEYNKPSTENIKLVYYGTLYKDLDMCFQGLAQVLFECTNVTLDIYTWDKGKYSSYFNAYNLMGIKVNYFDPVPSSEIMHIMGEADYLVFPYPWYLKNQMITKFYEIFYSKKPIILLTEKGIVGTYIENNGLGVAIQHAEILNKLPLVLKEGFDYNTGFDTSPYEFTKLSKGLINLIDKLN